MKLPGHLNRKTKLELIEYVMTLECHRDDARLAARSTLGELELAKRLHAEEIEKWKERTADDRIDTLEHELFLANEALEEAQEKIVSLEDTIKEVTRERDEANVLAESRDEHADACSAQVEGLRDAIATLQRAFADLGLPTEHVDEPLNVFNMRRAIEDADVVAYHAQQSL